MATWGDLINASLREITVLAGGETATANDATDALAALNRLLSRWNAERLQLYTVTRTTWTIAASDGQYTVGASADVNVARPTYIEAVKFQDTSLSSTTEFPLTKLTEAAWQGIKIKTQTATYPSAWYYNPTVSTGTLDLWPVPTSSTLEGVMYSWGKFSSVSSLTASVTLPDGYEEMIVKNLALTLCPTYGKQPHPLLVQQAREAIAVVKESNHRPMDMPLDPGALIGVGSRTTYDITQG